ncbi:MAG: RimJ/RimL family protein N-acetyltransferase [Woeseiaceae bacterium]|jgi:RimJ/RimL family protein N-acetyltransferase
MDTNRECFQLQTITDPVNAEITTDRLLLRKPTVADASAIFDRYASDPVVCQYLAWPMHRTVDDTLAFLEFSDTEWAHWPAGPYLIFSKAGDALAGSKSWCPAAVCTRASESQIFT